MGCLFEISIRIETPRGKINNIYWRWGTFDESKEALLGEGRTLAKLDHPGIVSGHYGFH